MYPDHHESAGKSIGLLFQYHARHERQRSPGADRAVYGEGHTGFDSTKYGCGITGRQGTKLVIGCGRSVQDTLGWTVVFDPNKVDTAAGCVGGGARGAWLRPRRHGLMRRRGGASPIRGSFPERPTLCGSRENSLLRRPAATGRWSVHVDDRVGTADSDARDRGGYGGCPAGSAGCSQVTVDGEPCDSSPAAGEATGAGVCPKNPAWVYLQDAKVAMCSRLMPNSWCWWRRTGTSGRFSEDTV